MTSKTLSSRLSDQYGVMNNGPHERPFVPVKPRSLAFHAAFWFDRRLSRQESLQELHAFSNALFKGINAQANSTNTEQSRTWIATKEEDFGTLTYITEGHTEYWRLSIILTLGESGVECKFSDAKRIFDSVSSRAELDYSSEAICSALVDNYYNYVIEKIPDHDILQECFSVFLGPIFWLPEKAPQKFDDSTDNKFVWSKDRYSDPRAELRSVWKIADFLQGGYPCSATPGKPAVEMTASTFLHHRAIYASSLGHPLSREIPALGPKKAVIYCLFVCFHDSWQLGRLIDNIHSMGTLRLAALRDAREISATSECLGSIRRALRENHSLQSIQKSMDTVLRKDSSWRIERSLRYWKQFESRIERLRSKRIEGFQPYEAFVRRRIGDYINYLDSTGRELALLRKEVDLRYQYREIEELLNIQKAGEYLLVLPLWYYLTMILEKLGLREFIKNQCPVIDDKLLTGSLALLGVATAYRIVESLRRKRRNPDYLPNSGTETQNPPPSAADKPGNSAAG